MNRLLSFKPPARRAAISAAERRNTSFVSRPTISPSRRFATATLCRPGGPESMRMPSEVASRVASSRAWLASSCLRLRRSAPTWRRLPMTAGLPDKRAGESVIPASIVDPPPRERTRQSKKVDRLAASVSAMRSITRRRSSLAMRSRKGRPLREPSAPTSCSRDLFA